MLEEKGYIKHNSGTLGKENGQNLANSYYFLTNDRNKNVDEVKESLATKKKKTYKKKDKFNTNTNTNKDEEIVNNIVKEVEYNLKDDEDYEYKSNEYDIKIIKAVNKKLDELKKEIYDS
jgi:predicted neutral ceramidase superfamily lipid hydrolase